MSKHKALSAVVSSELVSCPFCGSDKIMCEGDGRSEMAWMCCQKCLAQGPAVWTRRGLTSKSARVRWNERAANGGDEQRAGSAATPKEKNTL